MTEDSGWPPAEPNEDQSATPVPDEHADPQEVAEEAADAEPLAGDDSQPSTPEPNWLLDMRTQHPDSALLTAIEDLYRRVVNLGG